MTFHSQLTSQANRSDFPRLLLTAQDVGAVGHTMALAECAATHGLDCCVVAEGPAQAHLAARGLAHLTAQAWLGTAFGGDAAIAMACSRLLQQGVGVVVSGRSGDGQGIDRTVVGAARRLGIPSVVVQDFWGDVCEQAARPDHYFVIDEQAAALTRRSSGARVHVVGSLKHARFAGTDFGALRRHGRMALDVGPDVPVVGYFGQDLLHLDGYRQVLRDLAHAVDAVGRPALLYRPHPREAAAARRETRALLSEGACVRLIEAEGLAVEEAIAAVDVVVSCFSTVSLDAAHMMLQPGAPQVSIVCADYPDDVSSFWRPATGLSEFPMVSQGIAIAANDGESLRSSLLLGLDVDERARQSTASRLAFGRSPPSVDAVLGLLRGIATGAI